MKSPSAKAYDAGVRAEAAFIEELRRCQHPQAEPVILSTGELVACVCIGCYQPLPADYIGQQVEQAQRKAFCTHAETMEIVDFGRAPADSRYSCAECGGWVSVS